MSMEVSVQEFLTMIASFQDIKNLDVHSAVTVCQVLEFTDLSAFD